MLEDDFIGYICPYRHEYLESLRQYFLRSVKRRYYSVDEHVLVMESTCYRGCDAGRVAKDEDSGACSLEARWRCTVLVEEWIAGR